MNCIYLFDFKVAVAVSVLYWFHSNLHYATYFASRFCCNPILLQNCRWLVMVGRGGLGAEGRACNSSYVVPGRGRWGSPVSLSQTVASAAASSPASSCTCAEALQSLGGRAGSPVQQLSWNTILASVDVNVPVMLETPQRYSFQEQVYPLYTVV